jgi:gliding motility-associated-like protein
MRKLNFIFIFFTVLFYNSLLANDFISTSDLKSSYKKLKLSAHEDRVIKSPFVITPNFTINDTTQCVNGNSFTFTNTSTVTSGSLTYSWSFGDGTSSTLPSPNHSFIAPGTYPVKLVAAEVGGDKDSITIDVTVYPKPTINFSINDSTQLIEGNNFIFTNLSTIGTGTISNFLWKFGDSINSALVSPSHVYDTIGTFNVFLKGTSSFGCADSATKITKVSGAVTAKFFVNDSIQCILGNQFQFIDSSKTFGPTLTYIWAFGDNSSSSAKNPIHTYANAGTYTVTLKVSTSDGTSDSSFYNIKVSPMPKAGFTIDDSLQCLKSNLFKFTNTSFDPSSTLVYNWSFGDGITSSSYTPTHTYVASGNYNIKLLVSSESGCLDSAFASVKLPQLIFSKFSINDSAQCLLGNNFSFKNKSTPSNLVISYAWQFGVDSNSTSIEANPVYTYENDGTYTATLVVSDAYGCTDTSSVKVIVHSMPDAVFSVNDTTQTLTGNSFVIDNLTSINGSDKIFYSWDFGDKSLSSLANPIHTFDTTGWYTIKMKASSEFGCVDTTSMLIWVYGTVNAKFSINDTIQCRVNNFYDFLNKSTINGGMLSYIWNFGDDNTSTDVSPYHSFDEPGFFNVTLIANGSEGGEDTSIVVVYVAPMPEPDFIVNDSIQCLPDNRFLFTNRSRISTGFMDYFWDLGDGTSSLLNSPRHTYGDSGSYVVKLIATTLSYGCKDSITKILEVGALTKGVKYDSVITKSNFQTPLKAREFEDASYSWTPNYSIDNSSVFDPVFYGDNQVKYNIRITDKYGCIFTDTLNVFIFKKPDFFIPNAFTPNGDRLNDKIRPLLVGISKMNYFKIYNRWGIEIFKTTDPLIGWDGKYKGEIQPMETYTWVASGIDIDGKIINRSGNFLLIK